MLLPCSYLRQRSASDIIPLDGDFDAHPDLNNHVNSSSAQPKLGQDFSFSRGVKERAPDAGLKLPLIVTDWMDDDSIELQLQSVLRTSFASHCDTRLVMSASCTVALRRHADKMRRSTIIADPCSYAFRPIILLCLEGSERK